MSKSTVRKSLPRTEWLKIINRCDTRYFSGSRDRALYWLMYGCGLRVGEAINLRMKEVDTKRGIIKVPAEGKSGERWVGFPDSTMFRDSIEQWIATRGKAEIDSPLFLTSRTGKQLNAKNVRTSLNRHAKYAGVTEKVHPHMMRHSYAYECAAEGMPLIDLRDAMGHNDISTTNIYLQTSPDRAIEVMQRRVI